MIDFLVYVVYTICILNTREITRMKTGTLVKKVKTEELKGFHIAYKPCGFGESMQEGVILGFGTDSIKVRKVPETWMGTEWINPKWIIWIMTNQGKEEVVS
jgi:hypothetical protein